MKKSTYKTRIRCGQKMIRKPAFGTRNMSTIQVEINMERNISNA